MEDKNLKDVSGQTHEKTKPKGDLDDFIFCEGYVKQQSER